MIFGLLAKSFRETGLLTILMSFGLLIVTALLTYILPQVQAGIGDIFHTLPFVKTVFQALLGTELGDEVSAQMMQAMLWVHPIVLSLIWAHEIILCTRVPAGEIDRGTIDILLGLPVSRRGTYLSESLTWLASGACVLLFGMLGHLIAARSLPMEIRPPLPRVVLVVVNLYCLYLAVGGMSLLVSAISERRGRAMAVVFGLVLVSFLLNFLAQFWEPAQRVAFLSVMHYYHPAQILHDGKLSLFDVSSLLIVATIAWLLGNEAFARRSICTV